MAWGLPVGITRKCKETTKNCLRQSSLKLYQTVIYFLFAVVCNPLFKKDREKRLPL